MRLWPGSYPFALLVALIAIAPVAVLFSLAEGYEGLLEPRNLRLLTNTLLLTGGTVIGALSLGVPLGLISAYVRLPLPSLCLVLLAAPLAMPSYIGAFALFAAAGPGGELEELFGVRTPGVSGLAGAILVMSLYTYPFVLLTTRAAVLSQEANLLNAARTLGMSFLSSIWHVVLPRARNGIAAGALLAALYALSDFGTPAIMGYDTFTRMIYVEYNAFGLAQAALLSLQLLVIVALILFLESRIAATQERPGRPLQLAPRSWQLAAFFCGAAPIFVLAILLPLGLFTVWVFRDGAGGFEMSIAWNSALASLLAALVAVVCAIPVAMAALAGRSGRLMERVSYFGFGVPGIVMGTALVYVGLKLPLLYQTLALLVVAYVMRFLPLAVGSVRAAAEKMDGSLIRAARVLGAGPTEAFRRVTLPLSLRGIIAGGALVFLEAMRELPATLMLAPTGFETLATYLWRVYEAGYFGRAAVPGLLLVLLSMLGLMLLLSGERRAAFAVLKEDQD